MARRTTSRNSSGSLAACRSRRNSPARRGSRPVGALMLEALEAAMHDLPLPDDCQNDLQV
jgi:hypothetical protein